jgi:hypothetical protein
MTGYVWGATTHPHNHCRPGENRDDRYTTMLSRFAARVMPVYSHLARLS